MSSFLPGPYKITIDKASINAEIRCKGGGLVAVVWSGKNPSIEVVKANAALLSTAPAMLEAIETALRVPMAAPWLTSFVLPDGRSAWQMLKDAADAAKDAR